jgi:hypothetical protein
MITGGRISHVTTSQSSINQSPQPGVNHAQRGRRQKEQLTTSLKHFPTAARHIPRRGTPHRISIFFALVWTVVGRLG